MFDLKVSRITALLFGWLACSFVLANVHQMTTIADIDYRGTHELAGTISFSVDGNDFTSDPIHFPVYVRFRLESGVVLSETLVAPAPDPALHRPYYLAAFITDPPTATINMPPDAISLVRWKSGENEFWIRVNTPSDEWIDDSGVLQPPTWNKHVQFRIGISGAQSTAELAALYAVGKANRPSNGDVDGVPASTELWVDASSSILTLFPDPDSELAFYSLATDGQTVGVETDEHSFQIRMGDATSANLSGDDVIARAFALGRSVPALGPKGLTFLLIGFMVLGWFRARQNRISRSTDASS